mmetsp:Transcript_5648/g.15789  ORF Transcript_5648/g.15789 Transcript_5648/m.15789 type:complete len:182 (-) Transcript_5648:2212-2757(-)
MAANVAAAAAAPPQAEITLENVHSLSTYDLRQELTRRGELERDPALAEDFGYRRGLERLVALLTAEKEAAYAGRTAEAAVAPPAEGETLAEKLKRQKEERKAAALARSRARQQDPNYFKGRKDANATAQAEKEAAPAAAAPVEAVAPAEPIAAGPETDDAETDAVEPLFAQKRTGARVHVR